MKKSRFLYLHPEVNAGKVAALEALQVVYTTYLRVCVEAMLEGRRFSLRRAEKQTFFPSTDTLSSQIVKNVRDHAIGIVSGWAASLYATKLRRVIQQKFKAGEIADTMRHELCIIGKCSVGRPSGLVTQEALDLYWSWLLDPEVAGKQPTITDRCGMRLSEMTATLATPGDTSLTRWWLGFSHLSKGKPHIEIPLVANPYVRNPSMASKGILARKTKQGRWRFEVVDRKTWEVEEAEGQPRVGVDVGLNVMAATSDGLLLGQDLKPRFDALYGKVQTLRANRQRQGLRENSPRLDVLESKLTGLTKTAAGTVANKLVSLHPGYTFVVEDLDLRGCRGQKRFAYRAVQVALATKAPILKENPAYTSQLDPSCGHVSRNNRNGVKFCCQNCGRKSHADVVGAINLLGRSRDQQIDCDDHPSEVKALLRERYLARRKSSSSAELTEVHASEPSDQKLTTERAVRTDIGTASNSVVASATSGLR